MIDMIRLIAGIVFIVLGILVFALEIIGVYRFKYALNRMHAAAMGDTLGLLLSLIGIIIFCGFRFATVKLFLIVIFFWITSPVASHMLARLEVESNDHIEDNLKKMTLDDAEKEGDEK